MMGKILEVSYLWHFAIPSSGSIGFFFFPHYSAVRIGYKENKMSVFYLSYTDNFSNNWKLLCYSLLKQENTAAESN